MDELYLGLCIIKVLCLIVIAMGINKMANQSSYFADFTDPGRVRYLGENSFPGATSYMSGANEAPVFWNIGNLSEIDTAQQASVLVSENDAAAYSSNVTAGDVYAAAVAAGTAPAALSGPALSAAAQNSVTSGVAAFGNRSYMTNPRVQKFEAAVLNPY
jgi:hypothetical protein